MNVTENISNSRTSVAVTTGALKNIKKIAKDGNIRVYEVISAMAELISSDSEFFNQVTDLVAKKRSTLVKTETHIQRTKKLPVDLQKRLLAMSTADLTELLEKAKSI